MRTSIAKFDKEEYNRISAVVCVCLCVNDVRSDAEKMTACSACVYMCVQNLRIFAIGFFFSVFLAEILTKYPIIYKIPKKKPRSYIFFTDCCKMRTIAYIK